MFKSINQIYIFIQIHFILFYFLYFYNDLKSYMKKIIFKIIIFQSPLLFGSKWRSLVFDCCSSVIIFLTSGASLRFEPFDD